MVGPDRGTAPWPERLGEWLTSWVDRLPVGLRRVLPRELVGFAILGAFTFAIDLAWWVFRVQRPSGDEVPSRTAGLTT